MIYDPKIDRVRWGASRLDRCVSTPTDFIAWYDLVHRFHLVSLEELSQIFFFLSYVPMDRAD